MQGKIGRRSNGFCYVNRVVRVRDFYAEGKKGRRSNRFGFGGRVRVIWCEIFTCKGGSVVGVLDSVLAGESVGGEFTLAERTRNKVAETVWMKPF